MVFRAVEEVGKVEGEEGEIVGCVDTWIDVSQEPFVVIHYPLPDCRIWGKGIAVVAWT